MSSDKCGYRIRVSNYGLVTLWVSYFIYILAWEEGERGYPEIRELL